MSLMICDVFQTFLHKNGPRRSIKSVVLKRSRSSHFRIMWTHRLLA